MFDKHAAKHLPQVFQANFMEERLITTHCEDSDTGPASPKDRDAQS